MKKILNVVLLLIPIFVFFLFGTEFHELNTIKEEKIIDVNPASRIIETNLMSQKEKELFDLNLRLNNKVLVLYYETTKEIDKTQENLIVKRYTDEEIPYVIFVHNPEEKTLKTLSSSAELINFNDISLNNVESYTEVYRHLTNISTKVMTPMASQNEGAVFVCFLFLFFGVLCLISIILDIIKLIIRCVKWHKKDGYFLYKETFWERGYKVKKDPKNQEVKFLGSNIALKEGKDYFIFPKKAKNELFKTFGIFDESGIISTYKLNAYYDFSRDLVYSFMKDNDKFKFKYKIE